MDESKTVVEPGQLWIDNDPRTPHWARANRYLLVDEIEGDKARCRSWFDRLNGVAEAKTTRIALKRFRPTSTGYRLATGETGNEFPKNGRPV